MTDFDRILEVFLASSIGFDRLTTTIPNASNYPPHNVVKVDGNTYVITIAVAGFQQDEIDVTVQDKVLVIHGKASQETQDKLNYLHKGLAKRQFKLSFSLDNYVEVSEAAMKDGLLHIKLTREVPEEMALKKIPIQLGELPLLVKK